LKQFPKEPTETQLLVSRKRGNPQEPLLKGYQAATIVNLIKDSPEQLKLPFILWTREAVRDLINKKFKIKLSVSNSRTIFEKMGIYKSKTSKKSLRAKG